jgi:hypothetical protein
MVRAYAFVLLPSKKQTLYTGYSTPPDNKNFIYRFVVN